MVFAENKYTCEFKYFRTSSKSQQALKEHLGRRRTQSIFFLVSLLVVTYIVVSLRFDDEPAPSPQYPSSSGAPLLVSLAPDESIRTSQNHITDEEFLESISGTSGSSNKNDFGCKVPQLNPFHSSIKHLLDFDKLGGSYRCDKYALLFESTLNSTLVPVNTDGGFWSSHGIQSCCYQVVERRENPSHPDDSLYTFVGVCHPVVLDGPTIIPPEHEFISITCEYSQKENQSESAINATTLTTTQKPLTKIVDMHAFVPQNKSDAEGLPRSNVTKDVNNRESVNIVVLGLDAVSHMNFLRTMPKAHEYLVNNLSAIGMNGYNKVGDNTLPNLGAVLTALNLSTISSTCEKNETYDDCPFLWKTMKSNGYLTAFGEDSPWMGGFNYLKVGFKKQPTDYYLRPFGVAVEDHIGTHREGNAKLCYGPRLSFQVLLDYMKKFAHSMRLAEKRYFQFLWATSLTHDFLNYGRYGDSYLLEMLKWFQSEGHFNNTAFIVMSDHGLRWGEIVETPQGQLEERLPFLYFILPTWFKEKYARAFENLKRNQERLTTPFDFHETLLDIMDLEKITDTQIAEREKLVQNRSTPLPTGISQFLPVPLYRTCEMAGIEEHYCTCHNLRVLDTTHPIVEQAANFAVYFINSVVSKQGQCGYLSLAHIKNAQGVGSVFRKQKVLQLTFQTTPGNGTFQATVIRNMTGVWNVSGTISRINLYGNQSRCVEAKDLKMYCFCLDL